MSDSGQTRNAGDRTGAELLIVAGPAYSGKTTYVRELYAREVPGRSFGYRGAFDPAEQVAAVLAMAAASESCVIVFDDVTGLRRVQWASFLAALGALGPRHLIVLVVQDVRHLPPEVRKRGRLLDRAARAVEDEAEDEAAGGSGPRPLCAIS